MKLNNWISRFWVIVLTVCLLLANTPVTVSATEDDEETEAASSVIPMEAVFLSTPEDVLQLAENCVSDVWSRNKMVVLRNDIDLSGLAFDAIPTFGGSFLGQGHTISGLLLTGERNAFGFFRYLQKTAVVDSLHLQGLVQPTQNGSLDIGGLVGINSGKVKDCSFTGTVSGTEQIGGIAGQNKVSGIIEDCTVSGVVYGDHYIGGIAGENLGVIRTCVNTAQVNTQVDQNSVSIIMTGLSLESLTEKESPSDATNIGGIAGTSSGVIRACENRADVGYEKMGYNVGGIAGSQIGYITESINYGVINGSNGVGGIVGQFKPNVVLEFGENPLDIMTGQLNDVMDSMNGLIGSMGSMTSGMSSMMGSMAGMMGGVSFNMNNLEDAMDMLKNPENLDPDSINAALNDMSKSFDQMYNNLAWMSASMGNQMRNMSGSMNSMTASMNEMMVSMNEMVATMATLSDGISIKVIDISREDTPENTLTKVSNCQNYGSVNGEYYVGGVAGLADIEDTTVKDEIEGAPSFSTEGEIVMRLVIRDCRNLARVSANKQYAGGIVGNMTIGAVFYGMNTGNVNALNADYVGGIAGNSDTYITDSVSRSILAGNQYVGGIAGYGTEVVNCLALTNITAAAKFAGGVLGYTDPLPDEETKLVSENRYYLTGESLGGIDGICYEGATSPMTVEEFLQAETLDDMFRNVSVRFVVPGQEDTVFTVGLGKSLAVARIPQPETGEEELYQWVLHQDVTSETLGMGEAPQNQYLSRERLTNILFDQTYEAVFDTKNTVVASEEVTESGKALALAVGAFDKGTVLHLADIAQVEGTVNGAAMLEVWQVTLSDIGIEKLHYHIPAGMETGRTVLYVKDISGNWVQRSFTVEGSYMIFPFTHGESGFALELLPEEELPVSAIIIGVSVVILLVITGILIKKRKAKKKGSDSEKN